MQKSKTTTEVPIPEYGFLRLKGVLEVYPVSRSNWLDGVREGRYPRPVHLSPRTTAWRVSDIRALCKKLGEE